MKYGTRMGLGEQSLADVATQRGLEVERLRPALARAERERDGALARIKQLEEEVELLRATAFPGCRHERHEVIQQGQTFVRWKCKTCGYYGESSWD